jgi:Kdo2-lipid IVA lauroyltransferase/acyltransferase
MYIRHITPLTKFRYKCEAAIVWLMFFLMARLTIDQASALGGWLGRTIGMRLGVTKTARRNLLRVMPELPAEEKERIILGMWDNLGRTAAEFPHVFSMSSEELYSRVEIEGAEHLDCLRSSGGLIFSGHLANWEIFPRVAKEKGLTLTLVYREANNPAVNRFINNTRRKNDLDVLPKGNSGARKIVSALRQGATIAMLVDQKMNEGISVPFFGLPAMTAPAMAKLALAYNCPVVPATMVRLSGARFKVTILPPMAITPEQDANDIMLQVNEMLESWIRQRPEQWFWVHQRWGKERG